MAKKVINEKWAREMLEKMNTGQPIDVSSGFLKGLQWLVEALSYRNIPFRVYNVGAGVRRVTTETDCCPCCKSKLR